MGKNTPSADLVHVPAGELVSAAPPVAADRNPYYVYIGSLAASAQPAMVSALKIAAGILTRGIAPERVAWQLLRRQHVQRLRAVLVDVKKYKPATVNRILSAVRGVLREAWGLDLIDADAYHKARAVKLVSASTEPAGRDVEADELRLLFAACEDSPIGNRNAVVLALLYGCGLRRAEVARVDLADYNRGANTIHVHGKGKKERTVHLPAGARRAVDAWLEVRGKEPGPLICPVHKSGKVIMRRLDAAAIWFAIRGLVKRTNVAKLTPHDFRRTLTGDLLDAGVDLVTVQTMLGHADPKVTARYDRRPGRVRAAAAAKVNVPFNR